MRNADIDGGGGQLLPAFGVCVQILNCKMSTERLLRPSVTVARPRTVTVGANATGRL